MSRLYPCGRLSVSSAEATDSLEDGFFDLYTADNGWRGVYKSKSHSNVIRVNPHSIYKTSLICKASQFQRCARHTSCTVTCTVVSTLRDIDFNSAYVHATPAAAKGVESRAFAPELSMRQSVSACNGPTSSVSNCKMRKGFLLTHPVPNPWISAAFKPTLYQFNKVIIIIIKTLQIKIAVLHINTVLDPSVREPKSRYFLTLVKNCITVAARTLARNAGAQPLLTTVEGAKSVY